MSGREQFIANVRRALGRKMGDEPGPPPESAAMPGDAASAEELATAALQEAEASAGELMAELEESAAQIGWTVARVRSAEGAGQYVETLAAELEARSVVRSGHEVVEELRLEDRLADKDISVGMLVLDEDNEEQSGGKRETWRSLVLQADIGVTGVDYAIAETGSCVVQARKGVSRLVSLTPPVHVAVVRYGQVLSDLDGLFAISALEFSRGEGAGYTNIISGPSRSADIEQTIVVGVHGPREAHMVLVG